MFAQSFRSKYVSVYSRNRVYYTFALFVYYLFIVYIFQFSEWDYQFVDIWIASTKIWLLKLSSTPVENVHDSWLASFVQ